MIVCQRDFFSSASYRSQDVRRAVDGVDGDQLLREQRVCCARYVQLNAVADVQRKPGPRVVRIVPMDSKRQRY